MTILEQRYLDRMPNILNDLVKELARLTEEVAKLNEKVENLKPDEK